MQRMPTGTIAVSIFFIFVIILSLVFLKIEYEVPQKEDWTKEVKRKKQPLTENIRVVDADTGRTLFWYNEDGAIQATKVEKNAQGEWIVTIKDISKNK